MHTRFLKSPLKQGIIASAALLALSADAQLSVPGIDGVQTATGQFITPQAVPRAVLLELNPRLLAYPNFVAGEAVRSQLSPNGKTLAVLCAGQNSLYKPDGTVDTAHSTQYLFLYDVSGARKVRPAFMQAIA